MPPYARYFSFALGGSYICVPGEILSAVPGSKLDELAQEKPFASEITGAGIFPSDVCQVLRHHTIPVTYDRDAFKYLINRINMLRCHPVVESEDDFPVVTEVSIPSNVDRNSIWVLAGALGVECIL